MYAGEVILKRSESFVDLRQQSVSSFEKAKISIEKVIDEYVEDNIDNFSPEKRFNFALKIADDNKFIHLLYHLSRCNEEDRILYLKKFSDLIQEDVFSASKNYNELETNLAEYAGTLVEETSFAKKFLDNLNDILEQERINIAENDTMSNVSIKNNHTKKDELTLLDNNILRRTKFFPNSCSTIASVSAAFEGKITSLFDKNADDVVLQDFYKIADSDSYVEKRIAIENLIINCRHKLSQKKYDDVNNLLENYRLAVDLQRVFLSKFFVYLNDYIEQDEIKIAEYETTKDE